MNRVVRRRDDTPTDRCLEECVNQRGRRRGPRRWALVALAASAAVRLLGQDIADDSPPPLTVLPPESASSLLSLSIGDDEVDFFLEGRWRTTVTGTLAARFVPGPDRAFPATMAALPATGLESIPELSFSIWLAERYFLETQLQGDFDSILLFGGYQGRAPELLHHLYIGNVAFAAPRYPFIELPTVQDAIGIDAELATERSQHRLIVRHERVRRAERLFQGSNRVAEERVALGDHVRNRFFYLPDGTVESVTLLLEQVGGALTGSDGRAYRALGADEATVDTATGTLSLAAPASGRLLVHWLVAGTAWDGAGVRSEALPGVATASPSSRTRMRRHETSTPPTAPIPKCWSTASPTCCWPIRPPARCSNSPTATRLPGRCRHSSARSRRPSSLAAAMNHSPTYAGVPTSRSSLTAPAP